MLGRTGCGQVQPDLAYHGFIVDAGEGGSGTRHVTGVHEHGDHSQDRHTEHRAEVLPNIRCGRTTACEAHEVISHNITIQFLLPVEP